MQQGGIPRESIVTQIVVKMVEEILKKMDSQCRFVNHVLHSALKTH